MTSSKTSQRKGASLAVQRLGPWASTQGAQLRTLAREPRPCMTLGVAENKESVPDKHGHAQKAANVRSSSGFLAERWGQERQDRRVKGRGQGGAGPTTVSHCRQFLPPESS